MEILRTIYQKYKEIIKYIFWGVLATVVSIVSFGVFNYLMNINELIANILSWIITVLFAFITNRHWVFEISYHENSNFLKHLMRFYCGRLLSLILEEIMILIFITLLEFPSILVKTFVQLVVITINYLISKLWIFKSN